MNISVVFPAYNEGANITSAMERAIASLSSRFDDFEIIIVNDGSSDQTGSLAEGLAEQHPQIKILHNPVNLGVAESLHRGFQAAQYEWVTHNGMDYPFDLDDLDKCLEFKDQADIIVAARKSRPGYTLVRKIASIINVDLLRFLFDLKLNDYNFVQVYRKNVLQQVSPRSRNAAFFIPELLIRAHDRGFRIREVEIEYHPRTAGNAIQGRPSLILGAVYNVFSFWLKRLLKSNKQRTSTEIKGTKSIEPR